MDRISNLQYQEWQVDHLVILEKNSRVLIAAQSEDSYDLLFLVDERTGAVYVREGQQWQCLYRDEGRSVIARMVAARNSGVQTYYPNFCRE